MIHRITESRGPASVTEIRERYTAGERDFSGLRLPDINLNHAQLDGAVLRETYIPRASFMGASLKGANFELAHLAEAVFQGAKLEGASFKNATVRGARFDGARGLSEL